jgi:pre-mRNA-splicing factor 38A
MDRAVELEYIGGMYGNQQPTEFICLVLKLLQLLPEKEIIVELIKQEDHK